MCIRLKVHLRTSRPRTRPTLSHDQVIQTPCCAWGRCGLKKMQLQDGKVKWENSTCPLLKKMLGIDGEAIEFEWNIFTGFKSLQILQKIQDDLQERNIEPEKFTHRIIFMSMFNDIDWTRKGNR